jgi:periplasmic divalent cation tolerance protein
MSARTIYVTTGSRDEGIAIGRELVEAQLAACANVLAGATSVYRWQGEVREDAEAIVVLKTRADLVDALVERVKALHSYDCPCVVALPIVGGNAEYLDWIVKETS